LDVRYLPFFSFFEKNIFGFKTAKEKFPGSLASPTAIDGK
jgi:hypothetical protein